MNAVTRDLKLSNGEIVQVGMNFYALNLMTKYPGGLGKLQRELKSIDLADSKESKRSGDAEDTLEDLDALLEDSDTFCKAMDAFTYLFWALVRAGGQICTKEDCTMAIGFEDFPALLSVFADFNKAANSMMPKNAKGRAQKK